MCADDRPDCTPSAPVRASATPALRQTAAVPSATAPLLSALSSCWLQALWSTCGNVRALTLLGTPVRTELLQVNFPPKAKLYVHRVGRCARAGRRSTIVGTAPPPSPRFPSPTRLYSATRARADRRSSMQRSAAASAATRQRSPRPLRACPRRAHTRAVCSGKSYSLVSLDERAYLLDLFTFLGVEPQVGSYFGSHAYARSCLQS
jgi:hypothetical protein